MSLKQKFAYSVRPEIKPPVGLFFQTNRGGGIIGPTIGGVGLFQVVHHTMSKKKGLKQ